jgi:hypothetical protein
MKKMTLIGNSRGLKPKPFRRPTWLRCASMMPPRLKVPDHRMIEMSTKPTETS